MTLTNSRGVSGRFPVAHVITANAVYYDSCMRYKLDICDSDCDDAVRFERMR